MRKCKLQPINPISRHYTCHLKKKNIFKYVFQFEMKSKDNGFRLFPILLGNVSRTVLSHKKDVWVINLPAVSEVYLFIYLFFGAFVEVNGTVSKIGNGN